MRYGKQLGIERMVLQTNAIRLAQEDYLGALMEAGLDDILVSFHSSREEVSDSMTAAPGTWRKTVAGIRNALKAGLQVTLNVVFTTENLDHAEETVSWALENLKGIHGVILSPLQPHGNLLHNMELLPSYSALVKPIRECAKLLRDADVNMYLSYCENPLCWLLETFDTEGNPELRNYIARRLEANNCGDCHLSTMMDKDKVKPPACEGCLLDSVCFGVWRSYAEALGTEELKPVLSPPGMRKPRKFYSVAPRSWEQADGSSERGR